MRWLLLFALAGCGSSPTMMQPPFHRDGGLSFENGDLAGVDLASSPPPMSDLGGGSGDLAISGNCPAVLTPLSYDFEAGTQGFTHLAVDGFDGDNSWPFDEWQSGTPSGAGPGACHGGSKCWGTYIAGNYVSCERAELLTPSIDLSACAATNVKLVFWHWFNFWTDGSTYYDGGLVDFSGNGGTSWTASGGTYPGTININPSAGFGYDCLSPNSFQVDDQPGYVQSSGAWAKVEIPIAAALRTASFRARFVYSTGVSSQTDTPASSRPNASPGWYIDDVAIVPQ